MHRLIQFLLALSAALLVPLTAHAQISCTRGGLQNAVNLYLEAQASGDFSNLPLAAGVGYWLFNADAYLQYSSTEDWGPIPAEQRDTRGTLVSGPNGGSGAPDTHLFRVENGKLRYVHTLTHLLQANFQGN